MAQQFANLSFPLSGDAPVRVPMVRIKQAEFQHDLARVQIELQQPSYPNYRSNTPLRIDYGTADNNATFFGYVHHAEPVVGKGRAGMELVCIGTSYPLKQRRQYVYRDQSASDVAQTVADRHRLDVDIELHKARRNFTQAGESDLEFLVAVAHSIGYVVYINGTQLRFHTRTRDIQAMRLSAPRFRYGVASIEPSSVRTFKSELGETLPMAGRRADRHAFGVDPRTAELVSARNNAELVDVLGLETSDPFFDFYERDLVVHNPNEGAVDLAGITEDNRFHMRAHAQVGGDARTRQAMPVFFAGMPQDYGGYWFTHSVVHVITGEDYTMDLTLGRDSMREAGDESSTARPMRDLSGVQRARPGTRLSSVSEAAVEGGMPTTRGPAPLPPRGARTSNTPPSPVQSSVARRLTRAPTRQAKPTVTWQATHRTVPQRQAQPAAALPYRRR